MTPDESTFFRLLDGYARTRHQCFLAEMTFHTEERGYFLCFRPLRISDDAIKNLRESTDENLRDNLLPFYACKYLTIPTQDVKAVGSLQQLPSSLVDQLDAELSQFKKVV
jgi:hypothetical protein